MGKRKTASALAVVLSIAMLTACAPSVATVGPAPTSTSTTPDPGAVSAVAALHSWLGKPGTANIRVSSFETSNAQNPVTTFLELSGVTDGASGFLEMDGSQKTWTNVSTVLTQSAAVESRGVLYTTSPVQEVGQTTAGTSGSGDNPSRWNSTVVDSVWPKQSAHSIWWLALDSLGSVYPDGESVVNTKGATEYTGTVELANVPGIPSSLLQAPLFEKAGTTKVTIDLYTDLSTGLLVRVTYRFGLQASIDATPVGRSTAGFQVDLWGFDSPAPLTTPVAVPAAKYIVPGGNDDLCRLLIF